MVVTNVASPTVAGGRARHRAPLKCDGQRWHALAVTAYESRDLPLSYGGDGPKVSNVTLGTVLRTIASPPWPISRAP